MTINTETIRDAAEVLDTLTSTLAVDHPLRTQAAARAKSCVSGLYSAADAFDAQTAEIARLREAQAWQPIETAPHNETVLLGWRDWDDAWIEEVGMASWGWRNESVSNVSQHGRATHWMPLPAAPGALSGESND